MPIEPPASRFEFPPPSAADAQGIVGIGADLEPGTMLAAYRSGLFPMRITLGGPLAWWSPDPRGILPLDGLHVSRSLRRASRRFSITVDTAFRSVMEACADPIRPHGWIDATFLDAYCELHRLGWAHSVEVWSVDDQLVGGVYGIAIGGFFAGESMFHRATDASKVALLALVEWLVSGGGALFDVQWTTDHLASLGAVDVDRERYLELLADALARPQLQLS
ncbi:MAG: leucyl/phenylalanyl-tRNA--protein transferase [Acidimicrobiia bacterium]